jgi:hypothetical protein
LKSPLLAALLLHDLQLKITLKVDHQEAASRKICFSMTSFCHH